MTGDNLASAASESKITDDPVITFDEVTVTLGEVTALDSVTATIEPDRFIGLIGPNGAGKTTVLRSITGALTLDAGEITLFGSPVDTLSSREVSRQVAVVPQETVLTFDFAVREIIAMGRTPYQSRIGGMDRVDQESVASAMEQTGVTQFADRSISEVSGGERQRILIARALAQDTPILLLDEPTASLDINHQIRTLSLVRDLVANGKTVIAAIHDLNLAARYCDELLLISDGHVLAHASPDQIMSRDYLQQAFDTEVAVTTHPITGTPHITPLEAQE